MLTDGAHHRKGEFVIVVGAARAVAHRAADLSRAVDTMTILLAELPVKRASKIAARLLNLPANELYEIGLRIQRGDA